MAASSQAIKLGPGHHRGPQDGACVMELASMLAGEPFSDHPASVCPVIAAFLRSYNDHVDARRRQDLYRYAARAVGTRSDVDGERRHARMCLSWARETCGRPPLHVQVLHRLLHCQGPEVDGVYAARAAARTPGAHRRALALLDELIEAGPSPGRRPGDARGRTRAFQLCAEREREIYACPAYPRNREPGTAALSARSPEIRQQEERRGDLDRVLRDLLPHEVSALSTGLASCIGA